MITGQSQPPARDPSPRQATHRGQDAATTVRTRPSIASFKMQPALSPVRETRYNAVGTSKAGTIKATLTTNTTSTSAAMAGSTEFQYHPQYGSHGGDEFYDAQAAADRTAPSASIGAIPSDSSMLRRLDALRQGSDPVAHDSRSGIPIAGPTPPESAEYTAYAPYLRPPPSLRKPPSHSSLRNSLLAQHALATAHHQHQHQQQQQQYASVPHDVPQESTSERLLASLWTHPALDAAKSLLRDTFPAATGYLQLVDAAATLPPATCPPALVRRAATLATAILAAAAAGSDNRRARAVVAAAAAHAATVSAMPARLRGLRGAVSAAADDVVAVAFAALEAVEAAVATGLLSARSGSGNLSSETHRQQQRSGGLAGSDDEGDEDNDYESGNDGATAAGQAGERAQRAVARYAMLAAQAMRQDGADPRIAGVVEAAMGVPRSEPSFSSPYDPHAPSFLQSDEVVTEVRSMWLGFRWPEEVPLVAFVDGLVEYFTSISASTMRASSQASRDSTPWSTVLPKAAFGPRASSNVRAASYRSTSSAYLATAFANDGSVTGSVTGSTISSATSGGSRKRDAMVSLALWLAQTLHSERSTEGPKDTADVDPIWQLSDLDLPDEGLTPATLSLVLGRADQVNGLLTLTSPSSAPLGALTIADYIAWKLAGWMYLAVGLEQRVYKAAKGAGGTTATRGTIGGSAGAAPVLAAIGRAHAVRLADDMQAAMNAVRKRFRYSQPVHHRVREAYARVYSVARIPAAALPTASNRSKKESQDRDELHREYAAQYSFADRFNDLLLMLDDAAALVEALAEGKEMPFVTDEAVVAFMATARTMQLRLAACVSDLGVDLTLWSPADLAELRRLDQPMHALLLDTRSVFAETTAAVVADRLFLSPASLMRVKLAHASWSTNSNHVDSSDVSHVLGIVGTATWCGNPVHLHRLPDGSEETLTRIALAGGLAPTPGLVSVVGLVPRAGLLPDLDEEEDEEEEKDDKVGNGDGSKPHRNKDAALQRSPWYLVTDAGTPLTAYSRPWTVQDALGAAQSIAAALAVLQAHAVPHQHVSAQNVIVIDGFSSFAHGLQSVKLLGLWQSSPVPVRGRYSPPEWELTVERDAFGMVVGELQGGWWPSVIFSFGVLLWELLVGASEGAHVFRMNVRGHGGHEHVDLERVERVLVDGCPELVEAEIDKLLSLVDACTSAVPSIRPNFNAIATELADLCSVIRDVIDAARSAAPPSPPSPIRATVHADPNRRRTWSPDLPSHGYEEEDVPVRPSSRSPSSRFHNHAGEDDNDDDEASQSDMSLVVSLRHRSSVSRFSTDHHQERVSGTVEASGIYEEARDSLDREPSPERVGARPFGSTFATAAAVEATTAATTTTASTTRVTTNGGVTTTTAAVGAGAPSAARNSAPASTPMPTYRGILKTSPSSPDRRASGGSGGHGGSTVRYRIDESNSTDAATAMSADDLARAHSVRQSATAGSKSSRHTVHSTTDTSTLHTEHQLHQQKEQQHHVQLRHHDTTTAAHNHSSAVDRTAHTLRSVAVETDPTPSEVDRRRHHAAPRHHSYHAGVSGGGGRMSPETETTATWSMSDSSAVDGVNMYREGREPDRRASTVRPTSVASYQHMQQQQERQQQRQHLQEHTISTTTTQTAAERRTSTLQQQQATAASVGASSPKSPPLMRRLKDRFSSASRSPAKIVHPSLERGEVDQFKASISLPVAVNSSSAIAGQPMGVSTAIYPAGAPYPVPLVPIEVAAAAAIEQHLEHARGLIRQSDTVGALRVLHPLAATQNVAAAHLLLGDIYIRGSAITGPASAMSPPSSLRSPTNPAAAPVNQVPRDVARARLHYAAALSGGGPLTAAANAGLGDCALVSDPANAEAHYRAALASPALASADGVRARAGLAEALFSVGQFTEALEHARNAANTATDLLRPPPGSFVGTVPVSAPAWLHACGKRAAARAALCELQLRGPTESVRQWLQAARAPIKAYAEAMAGWYEANNASDEAARFRRLVSVYNDL
ncbi:hypothetical protein BC828DRAFT_372569 [Blastocladiella britannica]|nr:hypothetical protein BC828DRAFT_372569 [Blastocladiella britannica]